MSDPEREKLHPDPEVIYLAPACVYERTWSDDGSAEDCYHWQQGTEGDEDDDCVPQHPVVKYIRADLVAGESLAKSEEPSLAEDALAKVLTYCKAPEHFNDAGYFFGYLDPERVVAIIRGQVGATKSVPVIPDCFVCSEPIEGDQVCLVTERRYEHTACRKRSNAL
jgi:hypothetical protein